MVVRTVARHAIDAGGLRSATVGSEYFVLLRCLRVGARINEDRDMERSECMIGEHSRAPAIFMSPPLLPLRI